jgi:hypothetical protein
MGIPEKRYLTDDSGNRVGVVVELDKYQKMKEAVEELGAIQAYDQAKDSEQEPVPFDEAMDRIESDDL